jgi:hypothetical protein
MEEQQHGAVMPVSHEARVSASICRTVAGIACTTIIALFAPLAAAEEWAAEILPACFPPNCLAVGLPPGAAEQAAAADGLDAAGLAQAIEYVLRSSATMPARVMAVRYQDGRLVRYAVSERLELAATTSPARLAGADDPLGRAFRAVTEREVRLRAGADNRVAIVPVALDAFLGNLPPTFVSGRDEGPFLIASGADDAHTRALEGAIGIVLLLPELTEHRGGNDTQSFGLMFAIESRR